jgi:hypothetical protein
MTLEIPVLDYSDPSSFLVVADWHEERGELGEAEARKKEYLVAKAILRVYEPLAITMPKFVIPAAATHPLEVFMRLRHGRDENNHSVQLKIKGMVVSMPKQWQDKMKWLVRRFQRNGGDLGALFVKHGIWLYQKLAAEIPLWNKRADVLRRGRNLTTKGWEDFLRIVRENGYHSDMRWICECTEEECNMLLEALALLEAR